MFAFGADRPRRRPSLTPMIDVVFLLLVFFMLASRFGADRAMPLAVAGSGSGYSGPPRLVDVGPDTLRLNGMAVSLEALAEGLRGLTAAPSDIIVLRPQEGASLQRLVTVMQSLQQSGFNRLALVE